MKLKKIASVLLVGIAVSVGSSFVTADIPRVEASISVVNNCWNGNSNYPYVMDFAKSFDFADVSSACFSGNGVAINVINVGADNQICRTNTYYFRGGPEDREYRVDNEGWQSIAGRREAQNVFKVVRRALGVS